MREVVIRIVGASLLVPVVSVLQKLIVSLLVVLLEGAPLPLFELSFKFFIGLVGFLRFFPRLLLLLFLFGCLTLIHLKEVFLSKIETFFMGLKALVSFLDPLELDCRTSAR
jgi:hypothetical protein